MSAKKDIALSFLRAAASGTVRAAYEKYIHPDFRHHNPHFRGDAEALRIGMEQSAVAFPHKTLEVIRVLEDGDFVVVHGKITLAPGTSPFALVHIFRFDGDRIIEEWEAAQEVPKKSPNANGMF